jgi:hypothetical protein
MESGSKHDTVEGLSAKQPKNVHEPPKLVRDGTIEQLTENVALKGPALDVICII